MSGMISERSANRGSCAQSCRKDYVLTDLTTGNTLDTGYLISAKDLGAYDHLAEIADAGIQCLKVEGRKKKPEYVATVTKGYRDFLDRVDRGAWTPPTEEEVEPLIQIFSRGFTGGMYGGRAGRDYITRNQPDNRGVELGTVVGRQGSELIIDVRSPVAVGDGLGFEPPEGETAEHVGFSVSAVRTVRQMGPLTRQAIATRITVPANWRVVRSSHAALLESARASYANLPIETKQRKTRLDARVFGAAGTPLKVIFLADGEEITARSEITLSLAQKRSLDKDQLREQLGRLGDTPFALGALDVVGLATGLFLPVSELNHVRQQAVEQLMMRRDWAHQARMAERELKVRAAVDDVTSTATASPPSTDTFVLSCDVYSLDDARTAAAAGATEICFDPFLRHPAPPLARVRALQDDLSARGVNLRLRTPTIVRPEDRRAIQKWLDFGLPLLSGHIGLVAEMSRAGRDVVADYAVNCFNQHTAAEIFRLGARRITLSVELTTEEMADVVAPWQGTGFETIVYGRPEGMTIEHCVLSAAFNREPTTCRDLCVQKHTNVELTDPAGYTFPVATDSACRNRLLHSRPVDGSEYLPRLWNSGLRAYRLIFNVPGDDIPGIVSRWRAALDDIAHGERPDVQAIRGAIGSAFTRGHFARAV
jgi:putative protease